MIITRRFWCANENVTKALTIDVRTQKGISDSQALTNAEDFAARKMRCVVAVVMPSKVSDVRPNYTIEPSR